MKEEQVILVDETNKQIGLMPKLEAHQKAVLHRAFSVFVFNDKNELMLQQRALDKYHSPGLWTNTCCSHQRNGESNIEAGKRRLYEEMGFITDLKETISFIYKAPFDNGLTEHEFDHVLFGTYVGNIQANPEEVMDFKYITKDQLINEVNDHPELFTEWFKICFEEVLNKLA